MNTIKTALAILSSAIILNCASAKAGIISLTGKQNQDSKNFLSIDVQQGKTFSHIGTDLTNLEACVDSEVMGIKPLLYIRNGTSNSEDINRTNKESLNELTAGLGYKFDFGKGIFLGLQGSLMNNSYETSETEKTTSTDHFVDAGMYDYYMTVNSYAEANTDTKVSVPGAYFDFGSDKLKLFADFYSEEMNMTGNLKSVVDTIISGTIASTPVYDVTSSTTNVPISQKQSTSGNTAGVSYYYSGPFVATLNVYNSNNSIKAGARAVLKTKSYKSLDDIAETEKEINKYLYSGAYNSIGDNRIRLAEKKGYENTVIISVNTDNKESIEYNGENFRAGLGHDNDSISASLGYKWVDAELIKTKDNKTNYSLSCTFEF